MRLLKNIAFWLTVFCLAGDVHGGQASARLSSLSDSLIKNYLARGVQQKVSLAVFQFNCDEHLEKRRVGFAVSELMSHRFVADGTFTVVERGEIGKLLQEQRLQASGAVDNDVAVRLGQLAGASVVLLGNIQKVSGEYQVNARLVSVETGEVLASGYAELDERVFESDAYGYIGAISQTHPVGLYFLYNYRYNGNKLPRSERAYAGETYSYNPHAFSAGIPGIGLRYTPFPKVQLDVSFFTTGRAGVKTAKESISGAYARTSEITTEIYVYRGILSYQKYLSRDLMCLAGLGISKYSLNSDRDSYTSPMMHARLEYRLQRRIGLSLAANYDLTAKTFEGMRWMGEGVPLLKLSRFYFEPSLAIYF